MNKPLVENEITSNLKNEKLFNQNKKVKSDLNEEKLVLNDNKKKQNEVYVGEMGKNKATTEATVVLKKINIPEGGFYTRELLAGGGELDRWYDDHHVLKSERKNLIMAMKLLATITVMDC